MSIGELGYPAAYNQYIESNNLGGFEIGRIISEHKERYVVVGEKGEFDAEITGNMRFTTHSRTDFPAVGDWVAFMLYNNELAIIHRILPRKSAIERQAVGKFGEKQIIAANIDYAFIVQAIDRDFNVNRLERYLTIANTAGVKPLILLSKVDLVDEAALTQMLDRVSHRIRNVPVVAISNQNRVGYNVLNAIIEKGKTYCFLGSSGVGKSTLINGLAGREFMRTDSISYSSQRGKHVTSHRQLVVLANGGILIDNPGMREVGVTNSTDGLELTFDSFSDLAKSCKYPDCTHTHERGCAILSALGRGELDSDSYQNYLKMQKEQRFFQTTVAEKRRKDKAFGKILKDYKKTKKRNEE
jgi:ribosome biogenesis GTPase